MTITQPVAHFFEGFTNTSRFPYVSAVLACGHHAKAELKPRRGRCCGCEAELDLAPVGTTHCACGGSAFVIVWRPSEHVAADRLTQVGDQLACTACELEAEALAFLETFDMTTLSHSRFKYGSYHLYRREPASPSGVMLIRSLPATPAVERALNAKRISPLSPTEGL